MTRQTPSPLAVHLWCMRLIRALEEANPGRPIGVYFAGAQRYVRERLDTGDGHPFMRPALRHLKAGCPTPKLDNLTVVTTSCGGLNLHA